MKVKIDGFHGTDMKNVDGILENGFNPSLGDKEWLGTGAYFFVKGINEHPETQAEQWAVVDSWNKSKKQYEYDKYAVLHGVIEVDEKKFLDLTVADGVEILDYIQEKYLSKLAGLGRRLLPIDGCLINFARGEKLFDIEVVKGNMYIKLKKKERILKISRRTPNCTICSVYAPQSNIVEIKVLKKGRVNYEIG
ncbi:hypothetical protein [Prevotella sp.]|uniref:hypothetical protein n=1 Tax=Prevotella sp. TaxID=59823 RepID=UPI002675CB32